MSDKNKIEATEEFVGVSETSGVNVEIASNLTISEEVIGIIAGLAAAEVEGVSGMTLGFVDGINQMLGNNKKYSKGVKIELDRNEVTIDLYVIVRYGVKIPDVAFSIQNSVKNSVESMTGLNVKAVNINVQGVTFDKKNDAE
jgi:uncharacterized alkaline shock family protein YloU